MRYINKLLFIWIKLICLLCEIYIKCLHITDSDLIILVKACKYLWLHSLSETFSQFM